MLGIDVGYGNTKIFNGKREFGFPSVFFETAEPAEKTDDPSYIHFVFEGRMYYIGKKAMSNGGNTEFDHEDIFRHKIFTLAGICRATNGDDYEGKIGVGLPKADMASMSSKLKSLAGRYSVEYNGKPVNINITSVDVNIQGQCVIDEIKKYEDIDELSIAIIDIGQKTTDTLCYRDGYKDENSSCSYDIGTVNALSAIADEFRSLKGYEIASYRVPAMIKSGKIAADMADKHFNVLSKSIISVLRRKLNFREFDAVYLVGGGSAFCESFLKKEIPSARLHESYVYANARAYYLH